MTENKINIYMKCKNNSVEPDELIELKKEINKYNIELQAFSTNITVENSIEIFAVRVCCHL